MASKNAPNLIVSGAGWLMQFGVGVIRGLRANGYCDEHIHRLATQQGEEELQRGIDAFCRAIASPWREENGVIYFSVTSDNETGAGWIKRLEGKGFRLSNYAKSLLRSSDFQPTSGVRYEVAVLKGGLFSDRTTQNIRAEADNRSLTTPNAEVACLIRNMFSDEELEAMSLWAIIVMHESIEDSGGGPDLLGARRSGGGLWLGAYYGRLGFRWDRGIGFAFVLSQVSTES